MGKGSSPAGNTTVTNVNPAQQAQQPFLTNLYQEAQNIWGNLQGTGTNGDNFGNPYAFGAQTTGLGNIYANNPGIINAPINAANVDNSVATGGNPSAGSIAQLLGLGGALPAAIQTQANNIGSIGGTMQGNANNIFGVANQMPGAVAPSVGSLTSTANNAISGNPALVPLEAQASGAYLNANPALEGAISAAQQPTVLNYMTATAPQTDSSFEAAGRYGSPTLGTEQVLNQYGLGTNLGNIASSMSNANYANALNEMGNASGTLAGAYNTGTSNAESGYSTGGQLSLDALLGQSGALGAGSNVANLGAADAASAAQALSQGYGVGGGLINNAGGLSNSGSLVPLTAAQNGSALSSIPSSVWGSGINAPFQSTDALANIIGGPQGGSNTQTAPFFTNPTANLLGTGLGALSLGNGLSNAFGSGGFLSGLFGGGAGSGLLSAAALGTGGLL